ncbi:putative molybdopterin biosynthesis protein [Desulfitispora alkaliphila]|uniref:molybdopterin biosynthesis protein n=1 Tax=Desulfitispora alkaliphila TaxID=622674 RepID=UPI003D256092
MTKQKRYLHNKPKELALEELLAALNEAEYFGDLTEEVDLQNARGRVTAEPIFAKTSSPHYPASAMDGVAVRARDTYGAQDTKPKILQLGEQGKIVDTGDPVPAGFDAVIMIEDVHFINDKEIEIIKSVYPWQHVRQIGEDIVATEMVLPARHEINYYDIGGIAAAGITKVKVYKKPVVTIIPTGTELVTPGSDLKPGDIVEYNTLVLGGMVEEWGGVAKRHPIVIDDYNLIKEAVAQAVKDSDLVIVNAGSSAGREDYTSSVIEELGQVLTHGVAIKPGKPTILGVVQGKPVLGMPGYPVSAALGCRLFVRPLMYKFSNGLEPAAKTVEANMSRKYVSPLGSDEYLRVKLGKIDEKLVAMPISKGAGVISSMIEADGVVVIPDNSEGLNAGESVQVELLKDLAQVENTVVVNGSHDISLDILKDFLSKQTNYHLSSSHSGSLGGLMALKRGEADCAGIHLLDPETGEYNITYVKKMLGNQKVKVVNLAYRQQGIIVPKGNPLGIEGISDLTKRGISFVNRQKGSGTRVLLDYMLNKEEIAPGDIDGYQREEYTHLAVGAAVENGTATAGLGILAAAKAFDLDFIPIFEERYDICIPENSWQKERVQELLNLISRDDFKNAIVGLGGYDMKDSGKVMWEV